jgi:hypothetical protein
LLRHAAQPRREIARDRSLEGMAPGRGARLSPAPAPPHPTPSHRRESREAGLWGTLAGCRDLHNRWSASASGAAGSLRRPEPGRAGLREVAHERSAGEAGCSGRFCGQLPCEITVTKTSSKALCRRNEASLLRL